MGGHDWVWDESEMARVREEFYATYGHLGDDYLLTSLHDRIVVCTESFAARRGYSASELENQSLSIFNKEPQQKRDAHAAASLERMQHSGSDSGVAVHYTRSGELLKIEYSVRIVELCGHQFYLHHNRIVRDESSHAADSSFRRYYEYLPQPALLIDPHSPHMSIVDCNSAYAQMMGYSIEELQQQPVGDFNPLQDVETYQSWLDNGRAEFLEQLRQFRRYHYEGVRIHRNGRMFPVRTDMTLVENKGRELLLTTVEDLSAQRQRLQLDYDRNRIYESITLGEPIDDTLGKITALLESQLPGARCAVWLLHENRLTASCAIPPGSQHLNGGASYAENNPHSLSTQEAGPVGEAVTQGRVVYVDDFSSSPWREHLAVDADDTTQSCWIFPLENARQIFGALVVYSSRAQRPQSHELETVEWVRRLAAIALDSHRQTERLAFQAEHDHLTGLPNRLLFEDRLAQALAVAERHRSQVALLMLDLDGFKRVNDTLGHATGDILLREVAQRLQGAVRRSDTVGRLGGDEFVVLLGDLKSPQDIETVAHKILDAVKAPFDIASSDIFVTASIGIALYPGQGGDAMTLLRNADAAMYRAKSGGKNKYEYFEETLGQEKAERQRLKEQLRRAFEEKQFEVYYQPQFEVTNKSIVGFEALLRWKHPEFGMILPLSFIPVAEESGIILKIGQWVIEQVCEQLRRWREEGFETSVAINISALQFMRDEFFKVLHEAIGRNHLPPQSLELELSEGVVMQNIEESARQMSRLHELGVRLTVDDFGTGYSSLAYLRKLPLSKLKIDQSFIRDVYAQTQARQLLNSMILLAHSLNLKVCAEGVEAEGEFRVLRELGCDFAQGFLLGKPLVADDVPTLSHAQGAAPVRPQKAFCRACGS